LTTKTIHYDTRPLMDTGKALELTNGFRAKQTNFTNNNERDGYDVFYDNSLDPPPPPKRQLTDDQLLDELAEDKNVQRV